MSWWRTSSLKADFTHLFSSPHTAADLCKQNNGGCHKAAECTQLGVKVFCSCQKGYKGDGFTCLPINPCADGFNGGCHEHAICTVIGPVSWITSDTSGEIWGISSWCQQKPFLWLEHYLCVSKSLFSKTALRSSSLLSTSVWYPFSWGVRNSLTALL